MPKVTCKHDPRRLYAWYATGDDGTPRAVLCVGCCDCGAVLRGAATAPRNTKEAHTP